MHPAHQVIVIFFFADAAEIGREGAADGVCAFADGVAGEAAARFEENLSVVGVSGRLLLERRTGERILPDESGDGVDLVVGEFELRHFGGRPEFSGVPDPVRNPFLAEFLAGFFQIGADLFNFLQEIVAVNFERFALRVHAADFDGEVGGLRVVFVGGGVVRGGVAELLQARDFQFVVGFGFGELQDGLARVDELFVLIIEAMEAVAADAALLAVELLAFVQDGSVLGDHVRGVALLAAGVVIFGIVERPEPVRIAAVSAIHGVDGAAIAAVARRAAKFFERMPVDELEVGMAGERGVIAFGHAEVGLGERELRRNVFRVGGDVAGLAAVHQAGAAEIIERRAGRIDVDLNDVLVEIFHGVLQTFERRGTETGQMLGGVLREVGAGVFGGLINFAALGDQSGALGHDAGEGVVELIAGEGLIFLNFAVGEGPVNFPDGALAGFGVFQFFLARGFGFFVGIGDDFVLIDERADFAARVLEGVAHGGALVVEESNLFGDIGVLGFGGFFRGVYLGEEGFVIGGGVDGVLALFAGS